MLIELDLPRNWKRFRLPPALHNRLHELLDRQVHDGKLSSRERREAEALVELADMLALMKLRVQRAGQNGQVQIDNGLAPFLSSFAGPTLRVFFTSAS